jgi:hypothetical protein
MAEDEQGANCLAYTRCHPHKPDDGDDDYYNDDDDDDDDDADDHDDNIIPVWPT